MAALICLTTIKIYIILKLNKLNAQDDKGLTTIKIYIILKLPAPSLLLSGGLTTIKIYIILKHGAVAACNIKA